MAQNYGGLTNNSTKINIKGAGPNMPTRTGGGGRGGKGGGQNLGGSPSIRPAHAPVPTRPKQPGVAGGQPRRSAGTNYNALAPLTPKQQRQQATKTIKASYAPVLQQENQLSTQATGIYSQQQADNEFFQQWLSAQGNAAVAHADAANAALNQQQQSLMASQQQLFSGQAGDLTAQANARAGNVSNNANATEFGQQLQSNQQAEGLQLNASAQQANAAEQTGNAQNVAMGGIASGTLGTERQRELAALNTSMTGIANTRAKIQTAETGDIQKEIARLQGVEVSKAQYLSNLAATESKLHLTAAEDQSLITSRTAGTKLAKQRLADTVTYQGQTLKIARQNANTSSQREITAAQRDAYQLAHGLGPYKPAAGTTAKNAPYGRTSTGAAALSAASQRVYYEVISNAAEVMKRVAEKWRAGNLNDAWNIMKSGRIGLSKNFYGSLDPTAVLNAALNINRGGLSPGDVRYLANAGLSNINGHFHVNSLLEVGGGGAGHP